MSVISNLTQFVNKGSEVSGKDLPNSLVYERSDSFMCYHLRKESEVVRSDLEGNRSTISLVNLTGAKSGVFRNYLKAYRYNSPRKDFAIEV